MTRKEAIYLLDNLIGMVADNHGNDYDSALHMAIDTMRKYQMMQADYETRLKADLVAMLTEIQLEIEEMDSGCGWEGYRPTAQVIGLIQQKINELKAESEG